MKKIPRNEAALIILCFALCGLVFGLTLGYNNVVQQYNDLADNFNNELEERCGYTGGFKITPVFNLSSLNISVDNKIK